MNRPHPGISSPCAAIINREDSAAEVHLLAVQRDDQLPAVREFGPFTMKARELISEVLAIETGHLSEEEMDAMLQLEEWGYIEMIADDNGVTFCPWTPPWYPESRLLLRLRRAKFFRVLYEPAYCDLLAQRIELLRLQGKPCDGSIIKEREKWWLIISAMCSECIEILTRGLRSYGGKRNPL